MPIDGEVATSPAEAQPQQSTQIRLISAGVDARRSLTPLFSPVIMATTPIYTSRSARQKSTGSEQRSHGAKQVRFLALRLSHAPRVPRPHPINLADATCCRFYCRSGPQRAAGVAASAVEEPDDRGEDRGRQEHLAPRPGSSQRREVWEGRGWRAWATEEEAAEKIGAELSKATARQGTSGQAARCTAS